MQETEGGRREVTGGKVEYFENGASETTSFE